MYQEAIRLKEKKEADVVAAVSLGPKACQVGGAPISPYLPSPFKVELDHKSASQIFPLSNNEVSLMLKL